MIRLRVLSSFALVLVVLPACTLITDTDRTLIDGPAEGGAPAADASVSAGAGGDEGSGGSSNGGADNGGAPSGGAPSGGADNAGADDAGDADAGN